MDWLLFLLNLVCLVLAKRLLRGGYRNEVFRNRHSPFDPLSNPQVGDVGGFSGGIGTLEAEETPQQREARMA